MRECITHHHACECREAEFEKMRDENRRYRNALDEIALAGITRPMECGEGDDGDGHFRRIAYRLISKAARASMGEE